MDTSAALKALATRSGLAGDDLAQACGWKGRSGPQPYFEGRPLSYKIAAKFIRGMVGKGNPPIKADEILELVEEETLPPPPPPPTQLPNEETFARSLAVVGTIFRECPSTPVAAQAAASLLRDVLQLLLDRPDATDEMISGLVYKWQRDTSAQGIELRP